MKTKQGTVSAVLLRIFAILFVMLFFWALMLAVVQSAQRQYYLPIALAPALTAVLLLIFKKADRIYHRIPARILVTLFAFACIVTLFGMLYFSYRMRQTFGVDTWDFTRIQIDAAKKAGGNQDINLSYYAKYKNNQFIYLLLSLLFRFVLRTAPNASGEVLNQWAIALNCAAILTAVILSFCALKRSRGTHFAFAAGTFLLLYTPLWLYSPIYYTDTLGLPFIVLPLLLYTFLKSGKTVRNIVLFCIMGIVCAIGMKIKMSIVFIFIAIGIVVLLLDRQKLRWLFVLSGTAALVLTAFALQLGIDRTMHITEEEYDKSQFPYLHWVMMSLGENGGYDAKMVKYTASFDTMEERKTAVVEKTKELLEERGFAGTVKHVFVTKMMHTWGDGTMSGTYYLGREPAEDGVFREYFTQKGKSFRYVYMYLQTVHLMLLFGVMISGIGMFRRPEGDVVSAMRISVFGLLVFLLIWECNARYLVHIAPFLLIVSTDGMAFLSRLRVDEVKPEKIPEKSEKIS
ncbi:MAG: hypothetical protein IKZ44_01575 [Clostridia bacterium]|nr:hypothetical protein [Clostridia bacterium]